MMLLRARGALPGRRRRAVGTLATASVVLVAGLVAAPDGGAVSPRGSLTPPQAGVAQSASRAVAAASLGFQVQLGPEQRLIGPTGEVDIPYYSERGRDGKLFGVAGTSRAKFWRTANNTHLSHPRLVLDRGRAGRFDECGVWMMSIQKVTRTNWLGFYHAESKGTSSDCDHVADTTVWRMGVATTTDAGRTWRKRGFGGTHSYPDNVILTGTGSTKTTGRRHAGNGRVVRIGNFYYMFFQAAHSDEPDLPGVYVARAPVSGKGFGWQKYYCPPPTALNPDPACGFTEPGIGGRATPLDRINEKSRYVSWNGFLKRWIGLDASGRGGFRLFASERVGGTVTPAAQVNAALTWKGSTDIYAPVSTPNDLRVDQWGGHTRGPGSKQLYAYPSILGERGDSSRSGKTFYIYYMKLFPGDKFNARYLFRRKVTLKASAHPMNRVQLTVYKDRRSGKRRATTEAPKLKSFRGVGSAGYLLSHPANGWRQVFDCKRRTDFALFVGDCKTGWQRYRRVGWIRTTRTPAASIPVYRCFDRRKNSHFVATRPGCAGARKEVRLGFALRPQ